MDDLIKILQKLMSESPKPKGGIANTAEGIEFIGRKLTKDEIGGNAIIGSKLTDASAFKPFSVRNVGIENRYSLLREYGDDLAKKFEETITFIKNNPDVRFSQVQKDNILYNLGVYRRVVAEKDKIARGLTEQGKNVDDIFNKRVDTLPNEMLTLEQSLEKFNKTIADMGKKIKETEDIFKPEKVTDERKIRLKRLYDGPGYDRPNSSLYRGYGSFFLPKLHEKGIIKLDDQIYNNLKEGQHHWGGATYYAPDPIRIWRKHFGNEVFEKLDNFDPDNEDIFKWLERNNVQPIQKDGPKNALEYLTSTELQQNLADETSAFGKYKNPESAGDDARFFYRDKPEQRMERITYHGENIGALEQALQSLDPDSYKEYFRTKPTYDSKVLPFKELNAEGGRVGFRDAGYVSAAYGSDSKKSTPSSTSFDRPTMADVAGPVRSTPPKSIGPVPPMQTIDIEDAKVFDIEETGDPALNPGSTNVTGGIDYTPSTEPTFLETVYNKGKDFVTTAYNNPLVRFGIGMYLPTEFQKIQQIIALKNVYDRLATAEDDSIQETLEKQTGLSLYNNGGRVGFNQGTPQPQQGISSLLTPYQEYYNDKIIRDNMDAIREDMSLYFDPPEEKSFFDGITDKDIYGTYDERKGYDSVFKEYFKTEDGKKLFYEGPSSFDRKGLLKSFEKSDQGVRPFDIREDQFKEYEV